VSGLEIALACVAALGGASAAGSYLLQRATRNKALVVDTEQVRNAVATAATSLAELKARTDRITEDIALLREDVRDEIALLREDVRSVREKVSVLESKMDVFWKGVAIDVASVLHSPHPSWGDLDLLLDRFRNDTITDPEMTRLAGMLQEVKDGAYGGVPISRADQVAASLMLRAIEVTRGTSAGGGKD
jgi:hypothetical protein